MNKLMYRLKVGLWSYVFAGMVAMLLVCLWLSVELATQGSEMSAFVMANVLALDAAVLAAAALWELGRAIKVR
jgi:hypothetical protein